MINVSIIIPTKNIPHLLKRCIDSIPRRDDIQIIVVDDNSNSDVVDFENYPGINDPYVEIYFTKEGKGAGYARNIGLQYAKGKYVLFADSDDYFSPNLLKILDKYVVLSYDVVYFKLGSVYSDTLEPAYRAVGFNTYIDLFNDKKINALELGLNYCVPYGKLIALRVIKNHNLLFSETMASNDVYFATRLTLAINDITIDPTILYVVTLRNNSLTTTPSLNILYDRLNEQLRRNELLIKTGNNKYIGSIAYMVYCIYKIGGTREFLNSIRIINKSNTPLMTGWRNWLKTLCFLKKHKIHRLNSKF